MYIFGFLLYDLSFKPPKVTLSPLSTHHHRRSSKKAVSSQQEAILDLKKAAEKSLDSEVETSSLLSFAGHDSDSSSSPSESNSSKSDSY